ncbi:MAG: hypothetical protein AMXMBFR72_01570 [Betaproteobacteria bacterium]
MELVEREPALHTLRACLQTAATRGNVVLIAGEAGIGKTSVLRALTAAHDAVWWGACDALQTPHPLAPLLDIARDRRPRFAAHLSGPRSALFEAVLDELRMAAGAVLVVIEDAHWADDATLDLLKFLGRRIERTHALLAVSFRDDEVSASHPLRRVLGELPAAAVTRVELERLSPQAVETLARRARRSATGVFDATRGNPFFVVEVLREGGTVVPRSVQDLVLARFARLPLPAQELVRLAAVVPARIERWVADELLAPPPATVDACIDIGLLVADGTTLAFRHELARVAVEASLSPPLAQAVHARVLATLIASGREIAPARLVHHAAHAHDVAAVSRYAPLAAEQARNRGAHREAAAQWARALRDGAPADEAQRQQWLEAYALECQLTDQLVEAIEARRALDASYARGGQTVQQAHNLSRMALVQVLALRNAQADADSRRAIELLDRLPPSQERAYAYWVQAQLRMLNRDCAESVEWARRSLALAQELGTAETHAAALGTLGTALLFIDYDDGCRYLQQTLQLALAEQLHWVAANAYSNLGSGSGELWRLAEAEQWLREAIRFSTQHEIDFYLHYATAWLALVELYTGRWDEAAAHAADALGDAMSATTSRVMALVALGRLRLRRGDPGAEAVLDEALRLAEATGTLQRIAPVRAARAEAAIARGDVVGADAEAAAALPLAQRHGHSWFIGELAMWRWRAGGIEHAPEGCAEPFAHEMAGRWREAAAAWEGIGARYEQARALADGDSAAQRQALEIFDALGARPAVEQLRRRLRAAGVRGVPRGARATTRENPYGLTRREVEVLRLLCTGLRNAEIARRLSRSVRTVDHHVAALIAKLGVATRVEAIQRAQRSGLVEPTAEE